MELLEAQSAAANKRLTDAETKWKGMKDQYKSAYKGMLANLQPEIDNEKEKRLRNMGKTQAITDFLTALTNGIIGGATKGYAPQIGANAQPYAVNLENLREINKQRIENYNKLKTQADLSLLENDLKDAQSKYQGAAKGVADANEARNKFAATMLVQEFKAQENAKDRAARAAEEKAKKDAKTQTYVMGNGEITVPDNFKIAPIYSALVENGIPAVTKQVIGRDPMTGNQTITEVKVKTPTPQEFFYWVSEHFDEVYPYLSTIDGISINKREWVSQPQKKEELDYETALTGLGYDADTPYVTKGKKDKKVTINPSQSYLAQYGRNYGQNMNDKKIVW